MEELRLLVDIAKQQAATINALWNFYITVALVVAGWFSTAGKEKLHLLTMRARIVIAFAFASFTMIHAFSLAANYGILDSALRDASGLMANVMPNSPNIANAFLPFTATGWGKIGLPISIVVQAVVGLLICILVLIFGHACPSEDQPDRS